MSRRHFITAIINQFLRMADEKVEQADGRLNITLVLVVTELALLELDDQELSVVEAVDRVFHVDNLFFRESDARFDFVHR